MRIRNRWGEVTPLQASVLRWLLSPRGKDEWGVLIVEARRVWETCGERMPRRRNKCIERSTDQRVEPHVKRGTQWRAAPLHISSSGVRLQRQQRDTLHRRQSSVRHGNGGDVSSCHERGEVDTAQKREDGAQRGRRCERRESETDEDVQRAERVW